MLVHRLGATALNADDPARARPFVEESLAISSEIGNRRIELQALGSLAEIELREGNPERARELALQSLASARATGFPWWTAGMLSLLAEVELSLGRLDEAESRGREALRGSHEIGDRFSVVYGLAVLAWIASARDPARAGELWVLSRPRRRAGRSAPGSSNAPRWKRTSCGRARPSRAGVPAAARCRSMRRSSGRSPPTTRRQGAVRPRPLPILREARSAAPPTARGRAVGRRAPGPGRRRRPRRPAPRRGRRACPVLCSLRGRRVPSLRPARRPRRRR